MQLRQSRESVVCRLTLAGTKTEGNLTVIYTFGTALKLGMDEWENIMALGKYEYTYCTYTLNEYSTHSVVYFEGGKE